MIGIDANVVLRAALNDDVVWSSVATNFLSTKCTPEQPGFINSIVLAEIAWVLRKRPAYDRARLANFIDGLLDADNIVVGDTKEVERALAEFRKGPAGFADYLIAELNARAGATPTVTIDKDARRNDAFVALQSMMP